jgi:hypothetical protein
LGRISSIVARSASVRVLSAAQVFSSWAGQLDLVHAAADQVRDPASAARRAAIVAAVARIFPATAGDTHADTS